MPSELFWFILLIIICWVRNGVINMTDKWMPMGCSSSCHTFEIFSSALECMAQIKLHINRIIHLLDDLLIIAASHDICQRQLNLFVDLCGHLGIPIAPEKNLWSSHYFVICTNPIRHHSVRSSLACRKHFDVQRPNF